VTVIHELGFVVIVIKNAILSAPWLDFV